MLGLATQLFEIFSIYDYVGSANRLPVLSAWGKRADYKPSPGEYKEELTGGRSLIHRHCGKRMQEIATFHRPSTDSAPQRLKMKQWICPVCEHRVERTSGDPLGGASFAWVASHVNT